MLIQFWNVLPKMFFGIFIFLQPLWAFAADESGNEKDWVLSYFLVLLCLGLAILILLRPSKRADSAFSNEELTAQREEAMKKMKKHG
jgi:hypothetical protein